MTGIVFTTEEEAAPFLKKYKRGRFDDLHEGETQFDDTVLVCLTGTGKIKATLRTERLLQRHQVDRIIHVGTCTGLKESLEIGSLVAARQVFEGDRIELAAPTYPRMPLDVPFDQLPNGTLVTQDHIASDGSETSYWERIADISDMTGYAVAYVAATHGIPCHIVKVVTGRFGMENAHLKQTLAEAYQSIATFLIDVLEA